MATGRSTTTSAPSTPSDGLELISPASQRGRVAYMEPDDDIHYTLIALHVLEIEGAGFAWHDVADAWNTCLPAFAICTAEIVAVTNYIAANAKDEPRPAAKAGDPPGSGLDSDAHESLPRVDRGADSRRRLGLRLCRQPELAAEFAWRDSCWTHTANGIYGAMFFAAIIAAAFAEATHRS